MNIENIKKEFPIFDDKIQNNDLVYLDSANSAQKPKMVVDRIYDFYTKEFSNVGRSVHYLAVAATNLYENTRTSVQKYINAKNKNEIVFTKGATEAINLVANTFGQKYLEEGDEVLITELEHHSNYVPWHFLRKAKNINIKFAEVNNEGEITLDSIKDKITEKTKAIIPVHLYGQPVDLSPLVEICEEYNLHMIEDCAQAHFAEYDGKKVGTFGISGTFSFFPGKNLGAYGDAGCIISNDDDFSERARKFANHGALKKHHHDIEGINSRLDGLQAAILSAKLPYILEWNNKRLANAKFYSSLLDSFEYVKIPKIRNNVKHVFHLYVVLVDNREELQSYLSEKGISTGIHYPSPLPFLSAYKHLKHNDSDFPISSLYQNKILSLPMFPEITKSDMELVVKSIKEFFN